MAKYKFTSNIWLTFEHENKFYVGLTMIDKEFEVVACVSESGNVGYVPYSQINNPKRLKFLSNTKLTKVSMNSKRPNQNLDFDVSTN